MRYICYLCAVKYIKSTNMVTNELHFESRNGVVRLDVWANDEYGYDVDLKSFPNPSLTGSYTDLNKLIEDIQPYMLLRCSQEEYEGVVSELRSW